jgi:hypothetical protein
MQLSQRISVLSHAARQAIKMSLPKFWNVFPESAAMSLTKGILCGNNHTQILASMPLFISFVAMLSTVGRSLLSITHHRIHQADLLNTIVSIISGITSSPLL